VLRAGIPHRETLQIDLCTACARTFAIFKACRLDEMPVFIASLAPQEFFQQNAFWRTSTMTGWAKGDITDSFCRIDGMFFEIGDSLNE
jgi:hypothetical protein